ncbi:carboxymuconolactone decarboxylase family protein [Naasia lichenicola]|uniref:Carboxymuconolactone decarboxylase family protein n=1 Tax=Naasia lichenicola TaxID=2565933 RepID=A0A4S4FN42_9MICO|nr:carboxymuconolactone decarboxylase family protein [Naasia lichenicola]THG31624.1 carboxymuconolactone decarboxylase family protein [Naasia lichenicola]
MSRLPRLSPDRLDEDQRALYASIAGGPRAAGPQHFALTADDGSLNGPFNAMLVAPRVGAALQALGSEIRYGTSLSARVRELAILLVAARWDSAFERSSHEAVGRAIGLTEHELDEVRSGVVPQLADPVEAAAVQLAHAMAAGDVADDDWNRLAPIVGERAAFELATLVGYYATLALQLRVFRV